MEEFEDEFALWMASHHIRSSVPWRVEIYGREGPLTAKQVEDLARQFSFRVDELWKFSLSLGSSLSTPQLVSVPKSIATARANKEFVRAVADLAHAKKRIAEAGRKLGGLDTTTARDRQGAGLLDQVRAQLRVLALDIDTVKRSLETVGKIPNSALVIAPANKRNVSDMYRPVVLSRIFEFWRLEGRKLGYSTDPDTSERRGPLIEFTNAVVACITDPPSVLSGDTIIRELGKFTPIPDEIYEAFRFMYKQPGDAPKD